MLVCGVRWFQRRAGGGMTADGFRRLALGMPEATEVGHMGHPDFLRRARTPSVRTALAAAWLNTAPRKLAEKAARK
jgi:hypothetical protein